MPSLFLVTIDVRHQHTVVKEEEEEGWVPQ